MREQTRYLMNALWGSLQSFEYRVTGKDLSVLEIRREVLLG